MTISDTKMTGTTLKIIAKTVLDKLRELALKNMFTYAEKTKIPIAITNEPLPFPKNATPKVIAANKRLTLRKTR
tara:strand:- start:263 stop:484 length:222 start_codon:yes stop_codon:yes gene_type:complete